MTGPTGESATTTTSLSASDSDVSGIEDSSSSVTTVSLLDRLKAPRLSDLARKRVTKKNPPRDTNWRKPPRSAHNPKSITAAKRVAQYGGESFVVSGGKLFCQVCREEVALKKSIIDNHIKNSKKHSIGKEKLAEKGKKDKDIAEALKAYNKEEHLAGEELPPEQQVYRVKVITTFLRAGVPISKLDLFRDLLEENGLRLAGRRTMSDLIPFAHQEEQRRVKAEIQGQKISVIFDGTSRIGEAMAIILRFVDKDWNIQHRLIHLQLLAKSMTGEEIARELVSVLPVQYDVGSSSLIAAMRDRASVNNVAVSFVRVMYPSILDIGCLSHIIDNSGDQFNTPILNEFLTAWIQLFSLSLKARLIWKDRTGVAVKSYSKTRWWSKWEVANQIMNLFGDVQPFLECSEDVGLATRAKMKEILVNPHSKALLQLELAVTIDVGHPFVQATYRLEGDGTLALSCYEELGKLLQGIRIAHFPNVARIAKLLSQGQAHVAQQYMQYASSCVKPGFDYIQSKYHGDLQAAVAVFKAARLFNPHRVVDLQPDLNAIDSVAAFPFLNSSDILSNLRAELPQYLARATDISQQTESVDWWQRNSPDLPHWSNAARQVLHVQPSAIAERLFSLLNGTFSDLQDSSLQDYIETSLMLQFNH